jgi:hypothetical protein
MIRPHRISINTTQNKYLTKDKTVKPTQGKEKQNLNSQAKRQKENKTKRLHNIQTSQSVNEIQSTKEEG